MHILILSTAYAQTFPVIISSPEDEFCISIASLDEIKYHTIISYLPAGIVDSITLFSMNGLGEDKNFIQIHNITSCDASDIQIKSLKYSNSFIAFGNCYDTTTNDFQNYVLRLDENFDITLQDTIGKLDLNEKTWDMFQDSSGYIYLSGTDYLDWNISYVYKYTDDLQMNNAVYFANLPPDYLYTLGMIGILNNENSNTLTGFFPLSNNVMEIDKATLAIEMEQVLNYDDRFISLRRPAFLRDAKKYIIPFQEYNSVLTKTKVNIVITDEYFNLLSEETFGNSADTNLTIALDAIDYIDSNNIWIALTPYSTPDVSFEEIPHYIHVIKMNSLGEILIENNFGGDANYVAQAVKATPDGGALILCTRYDWTVQDHERDIYIYKIDSAGNLVTTATGIVPTPEQKDILVFPNPAHDVLFFQSILYENALIEIFDISGKKIMQQLKTEYELAVDISTLSSGLYLYKVTSENILIKTGKFVKE